MRINQAVIVIAEENEHFGTERRVIYIIESAGTRIFHVQSKRHNMDQPNPNAPPVCIEVLEEDLCLNLDEETLKLRACLMFSHLRVRHVFLLPYSFSATRYCMRNGCSNKATRRGFVHKHEVLVTEYDLCLKHAREYHGTTIVAFPMRANYCY